MELPDKKTLEALDAADWEDISSKLLHYALHLMETKTVQRLPDGMTAEDVVVAIIEKVYSGHRKWNPERVPDLLFYLKRVLESDLSGHGLLDPRKVENEPDYRENDEILDKLEDKPDTEAYIDDEPFTQALYHEIKDDDELELIVAALELDITRPADIAKETGIPVENIYIAQRRLKRKAKRAKQRMQEVAEGIQ
jgi:DNA-directed RNA polymerase specialized sigma24 family protein